MSWYFGNEHTTVLHADGPTDVLCISSDGENGNSESNVITLTVHANSDGQSSSRDGRKLQLHVEIDADTRMFIDRLADKAEVGRRSELVRAALREFECALFEYDELRIPVGVGLSPTASHGLGSRSKGRAAPGVQTNSSDVERFSLVLDQRGMDRVERLKGMIKAKSRAEVVLTALCVYDAVLDHRDELVRRGGNPARVMREDSGGRKEGIVQFFRRSG